MMSGQVQDVFASHGQVPGGANPFHSDIGTINVTRSSHVNNPDLRGFDPEVITGPTDVFPDTTRPCCLEGSTQFGNGLAAGSSGESINQNCTELDLTEPPVVTPGRLTEFGTGDVLGEPESSPFPIFNASTCGALVTGNVFQNDLLFQQSRNGLLSRPQTDTTVCDDLGAPASDRRCNEITFGFLQDIPSQQGMNLSFAIRSLTDANGNLIGAAQGTFTQSTTENGVTTACSGSFTFDETLGFVATSGPLHEC